jgi:hypothetical protein
VLTHRWGGVPFPHPNPPGDDKIHFNRLPLINTMGWRWTVRQETMREGCYRHCVSVDPPRGVAFSS